MELGLDTEPTLETLEKTGRVGLALDLLSGAPAYLLCDVKARSCKAKKDMPGARYPLLW